MPSVIKKHNHFQLWAYSGGIAFVLAAALLLWMLLRDWATLVAR